MDHLLQQLIALLTTSPGNLVYHVALAFSIFMALQGSVNHWRGSGFPQGRRMVFGLSLLLLLQLALFAGAGLAWQKLIDAHAFIPPLDRAAMLIGVVVIIWLWAFPESSRLTDAATILVGLLASAASLLGVIWWQSQAATLYFNGSWGDVVSSSAALILLGIGALLLLVRRPNGWGFGLAMLLLLFTGQLVHWLNPLQESDLAWPARLAELAAFPLLGALPLRFPIPAETPAPESKTESSTPFPRRYSSDPKVLQAFLALAGESSPQKFYQDTTRTLSQLMLADICLLVLPPDLNGYMTVPVGYNLVMDRPIEGFTLNTRNSPVLAGTLRRGRKLRLPASSTSPELQALARALNVSKVGYLMCVPIAPKGQAPLMGVVLLTPFSNRSWTQEDMQYLSDATETLASILHRMQLIVDQQSELENVRESLHTAHSQDALSQQEKEALAAQFQELRTRVQQERDRADSLAALVRDQDAAQETISRQQSRLQELENLQASQQRAPDVEVEHLEEQLRLALEDTAILRSALQEADKRLSQAPGQKLSQAGPRRDGEVISSIAQELRQPVSSIIGYTDLLLGESVGILGAMQRKFVERVKASTERMAGLLEDLLQATTIESRSENMNPVAVDLNAVIDEAVAGVIAQMGEKNITLRVNLPEELPAVQADVDALMQIVDNLLQNAGGATIENGEINLSARVETKENEPGYVLLQVSDTGGGIKADDLPRVFSRLYRTENAIVEGVGDNGVGLSLAKTLVEAQGGRIWVDTEVGRGSTFSVLLPLADESLYSIDQGAAEA
ncbi:MAG: GAF domain-containing protein [Anaerolineales bacterium]|nr:GAF domain-containing protein [Anaerolineales bacterium]